AVVQTAAARADDCARPPAGQRRLGGVDVDRPASAPTGRAGGAGADRAATGARDDDAAGLPRLPVVARAGVGFPVGAVPRAGVPLRVEGPRLPRPVAGGEPRRTRAAAVSARRADAVGRTARGACRPWS